MEILALLLLGLIAMLAIVPPIIRNKLEESPLTTIQSFQRNMQEIAHSIDKHGGYEAEHEGGLSGKQRTLAGTAKRTAAFSPASRGGPYRKRAAVRRTRIITTLTLLSFFWGIATLFSGRGWCLAVFAAFTCLLALYWGLILVVPYLAVASAEEKRAEETYRPRKRHAV